MSSLTNWILVTMALPPVALSIWAIRALPRERWQMLACVPMYKSEDGSWQAMNLTYYGLFNALAYTWAAGVAFLLLAAVGVNPWVGALLLLAIIAICAPASRWIAGIIEKKRHTLTVGGASFAGILLAPWLIAAAGALSRQYTGVGIPVWPTLAAIAIAYTFGEGIGRLACISFGCCYGRPVSSLKPPFDRLLRPVAFRFEGATRKATYASGYENEALIPIQAFTNALFLLAAMAGLLLFAAGHFVSACLVPLATTQAWRIVSEFLRADFRGSGKFTAYQRMSMAGLFYAAWMPLFLSSGKNAAVDLASGLAALWSVPVLLLLQALFIFAFLFTGRSAVTGARLTFHVNKDRI